MQWEKLISARRWGVANSDTQDQDKARSQFQRDYDRLIFSSPFRRLQNKTQVFPLPGSVFVHNRLTHSLEVASVGRSMGTIFYQNLKKHDAELDQRLPLISEVGNIVAAACLAHDMGNPAFGHSGEAAMSRYFTDGDGARYKAELTDEQWHDVINFEGNANAFRILTYPFTGKGNGAFALTYTTLASIVKYPCAAIAGHVKGNIHQKKYGFFQSEQASFEDIANELGLIKTQENPLIYKRHPLVYLVEAADDICYSIIDLEDAHRLKILSYDKIKELLLPICNSTRLEPWLESEFEDEDAKVGLLRAKAINNLITACSIIFMDNQEAILSGNFNHGLTDVLEEPFLTPWKTIQKISYEKIYNYQSVVQIEVAGYKVMGGLLEEFIPALINNSSKYDKKLVELIPKQFISRNTDTYSKIQSVLDFISGMTDLYAVELYRNIKGISFPAIH
ncbi:deoxyguanosinetriphosphate triphosphohydrolase [Mucilaginibacter sp. Bleaf8]|uniref:deoxyguanosinetriphosphate triphosphohydrolase n=1 Tax=Mucilaginibacter sp. Bleaf8 TaxID=2834430 RepID=UPI001BCCC01C|nr:deoxyguanosinetriphosphate triphosphohydrolase [Mucilaginibacter sp. Bleaf8]MBS7563700.1 deoxyguanosinetriphosphate triphosphohydrolase [Mucilaginibacter sp. Bleaf8]